MPRILFLSVFFSLISLAFVQAQNNDKLDQMLAEMESAFSLTPAQSHTVRYILEDISQQLRGIRRYRQSDPRTFRQKKRSIMQKMDAKILATLNESQSADYRAMRENSRNKTRTQSGVAASPSLSGPKPTKGGEIKSSVSTETSETETYTEEESYEEESYEEYEDSASNAEQPKEDMLERTLDFLYEGFVRPAVQKRKKKKN